MNRIPANCLLLGVTTSFSQIGLGRSLQVGGAVELAPGYLKLVYDMVHKVGGVCVADEVQTGFGRTGSHYWGFQTQDVIPDIVTMAKGIENGLPLGAVVTTPEIAQVTAQKIQFNTFGGNPVCSVDGLVCAESARQRNASKTL